MVNKTLNNPQLVNGVSGSINFCAGGAAAGSSVVAPHKSRLASCGAGLIIRRDHTERKHRRERLMDASAVQDKTNVRMTGLTTAMADSVAAIETYVTAASRAARESLSLPNGKPDRAAFERHQHRAHGLSWVATYLETLRQTAGWAKRLEADGQFGEVEALLCQVLFGEYCAQLIGGIPMNQGEMVRPADLGCSQADMQLLFAPAIQRFILEGKTPEVMAAAAMFLPDALSRNTVEFTGLDETMEMVRDQFAKFAATRIKPVAHSWHLANDYIPMDVVNEMAELGVFGLTIQEEFGGLGMGKTAVCGVSREVGRAS